MMNWFWKFVNDKKKSDIETTNFLYENYLNDEVLITDDCFWKFTFQKQPKNIYMLDPFFYNTKIK